MDINFLLITGGIFIFLIGALFGLSLGKHLDKAEKEEMENRIEQLTEEIHFYWNS